MKRTLMAGVISAIMAVPVVGLSGQAGAVTHPTHPPHPTHPEHAICARQAAGTANCHAHLLDIGDGVRPDVSTSPSGNSPNAIKSAYNFPTSTSAGAGQTIAIVDAYDDPTAAADLATFSNQFNLPCNNCLTKVNEQGGSTYPSSDPNWALEISLDIQWAHATAPGAQILLVEAWSASFNDLLTAEAYAASHAAYVSDSWGGSEFSYESWYDGYFARSGVSYFVAAGDSGLGAEYPSSSPNVISVGGTSLNNIGTPSFSETAWSRGGGGCSSYEGAPAAQSSFSQYGQVHCNGRRATPDVSADADPNSGVSVFDSNYFGQGGWWTVGGTSLSAPIWAARSAIEGAAVNSAYVYGNAITFRDITSGSNGAPALVGYDLATGRGSWVNPAPTVAPGAPTLNSATGGVGSVALSWSPPTSGAPVASYNVYRSGSTGPVATGLTGTSYTDNPASAGNYTYQVSAVGGTGLEGPLSNALTASVTAPPPAAPGAPNLTGATGGTGSIGLTWSAPTTGGPVSTYNVYRGASSGAETILQSGVNATSYTDNPSSPGTYFYYVTAVNGGSESTPSNERSATSTAQPPPPPAAPGAPNLTGATGGTGSIGLTWSAPTTGGPVSTYNVYRGTSSGTETILQGGVTATSYTDNPSSPGTYFYYVTAVNSGGESTASNERSATSSAPPPPTDEAPTVGFSRYCTYSACSFTSTSSDPDGAITSYSWSGGNGLTGASYRVTHGYTTSGTFPVNLTITDSSGQQGSASGSVTCTYDPYRRLICS